VGIGRLQRQTYPSLHSISKRQQQEQANPDIRPCKITRLKARISSTPTRTLTDSTHPFVQDASLNSVDDLLLPRGAGKQAPVRVILHMGPSRLGRVWVRHQPWVGHAEVILLPHGGWSSAGPGLLRRGCHYRSNSDGCTRHVHRRNRRRLLHRCLFSPCSQTHLGPRRSCHSPMWLVALFTQAKDLIQNGNTTS
jgi:hypothetical protein